jgi:peptide deformylase
MAEKLSFDLTLYPSPLLRRPCPPVEAFDEDLKAVVAAMFECMAEAKGVGLAAPQVGLRMRLMILNPTGNAEDALALVNPAIVGRAGPPALFEEGCLSFPGIYAEVERPELCTVEFQDTDGQRRRLEASGFQSRILQHEHDHLEGVLLVDRMSPADKHRHRAALEELVARYKRGGH